MSELLEIHASKTLSDDGVDDMEVEEEDAEEDDMPAASSRN